MQIFTNISHGSEEALCVCRVLRSGWCLHRLGAKCTFGNLEAPEGDDQQEDEEEGQEEQKQETGTEVMRKPAAWFEEDRW